MRGLDLEGVHRLLHAIGRLVGTLVAVAATTVQCVVIRHRHSRSLAAENLFLRKQLALFQEREIKSRRADDATRAAMVWLSKAFDWREALVVVKPATLIRWHREGFRLFWKLKSRSGRPGLPRDVRALIRRLAAENLTWGEERIANELLLKLGLRVSPQTVRKYMLEHPGGGSSSGVSGQRWATFVRNHAATIVPRPAFVAAPVRPSRRATERSRDLFGFEIRTMNAERHASFIYQAADFGNDVLTPVASRVVPPGHSE